MGLCQDLGPLPRWGKEREAIQHRAAHNRGKESRVWHSDPLRQDADNMVGTAVPSP
jgi:hypothetical protein